MDGFTARAGALAAGGKSIDGLFDAGERIGTGVTTAISGMGEAASGHAGLAVALLAAAEQGVKTFLDIGAAYTHASASLTATAEGYGQAEHRNAAKARTIGNGAR